MNRFRPFTIKDFDYGGEADQELYDMYTEQVARKLSGYNAKDILASANWDLQIMSNRYKMNPTESMARKVRAMYNVVMDNV